MRTLDAEEAAALLPSLLDEVMRGATIVITKDGVAVAHLVPAGLPRERTVEEAIADLRAFRDGRMLSGISVRELIEDGRRC